jgi:hypothetical protein
MYSKYDVILNLCCGFWFLSSWIRLEVEYYAVVFCTWSRLTHKLSGPWPEPMKVGINYTGVHPAQRRRFLQLTRRKSWPDGLVFEILFHVTSGGTTVVVMVTKMTVIRMVLPEAFQFVLHCQYGPHHHHRGCITILLQPVLLVLLVW